MITTASSLLRATALLLAVLVLNSPAAAETLDVSAESVFSVDKLRWRGGLVLTSNDPNFAQLSALLVEADGSRITSVTDKGYWVTVDLAYSPDGYLSGVNGGEIGRLLGLDGKPLSKVRREVRDEDKDWDAESLARLADESLVVAFEHDHRILQYANGINAAATKSLDLRKIKTKEWGPNEGVEALVTLANGELLAFIEGWENTTESPAYPLGKRAWMDLRYYKHEEMDLRYQHEEGFRPTGATRLPDGDVLVIERCYDFEPQCDNKRTIVRLRRLDAQRIVPGAEFKDKDIEEIAELKAPFIVDNFEGVAARRGKKGETLVYLLSDDNGKYLKWVKEKTGKPKNEIGEPIQRTLLLMFELEKNRE